MNEDVVIGMFRRLIRNYVIRHGFNNDTFSITLGHLTVWVETGKPQKWSVCPDDQSWQIEWHCENGSWLSKGHLLVTGDPTDDLIWLKLKV